MMHLSRCQVWIFMIKSNRYHLIASLIGIVSVVCLLILYRQIALSSMIEHESRSNEAIAELLSRAVRSDYRELITRNATGEVPADDRLISGLARKIEGLTSGSRLLAINIYDTSGVVVFSTDSSRIGKNLGSNPSFMRAMQGQLVSDISFDDELEAFGETHNDVNAVASHIGIYGDVENVKGQKPEAVFEVCSNVSSLYRRMQRTQWQIVIGVLGSTAIFYLLLLISARRLERIEVARRADTFPGEP